MIKDILNEIKKETDAYQYTLIAVSKTKPNELILEAYNAGVNVTNYGIAIAYMKGILDKAVKVVPEIS